MTHYVCTSWTKYPKYLKEHQLISSNCVCTKWLLRSQVTSLSPFSLPGHTTHTPAGAWLSWPAPADTLLTNLTIEQVTSPFPGDRAGQGGLL